MLLVPLEKSKANIGIFINIILTFFDVLNKSCNKKDIVKECFEKLVELKDDDLDRIVDVTYSSSRKVVTKIIHYEDKEEIV